MLYAAAMYQITVYVCMYPMDGGAWWAAVHGVAKSWTRLSDFTFTFHFHALEKEVEGKFKREGTYVYLWLIHVDV